MTHDRPNRRERRRDTFQSPLADKPFRQLRNPLKPVELLSEEQLEQIHYASMHILENIGIDFLDDEALDYWQRARAKVDRTSQHVWIDRGLLRETLSTVPQQFTLQARNPAHTLCVGGNHINFCTVGGAPFYSDLERGRQPGTLEAFQRMVKLAQHCGPIHIVEGLMVEPQDVPVPLRHLEKGYAQFSLSDKAITTAAHGRSIT